MSSGASSSAGHPAKFFTVYDAVFVVLMAVVFALVVVLGTYNYREAALTEVSKREAEALLAWFEDQAATRDHPDYAIAACGPAHATDAKAAPTWAQCRAYLLQETTFKDALNAFNNGPLFFAEACIPGHHALRGALVLEKLPLASEAGAPPVAAPLADDDLLAHRFVMRVSICNRDTEPVFVGETEF